jgi:SAM-dependent methyltransferase
MNDLTYIGGELALFAEAHRWKHYWAGKLRPYLRGAVLEVGAGTGSNTMLLRQGHEPRWLCLEPDAQLLGLLQERIAQSPTCRSCETRQGTLASIPAAEQFDTILYVDVLEHIENDRSELARAAGHLRSNGHLLVLGPAHNWLFSPFDRSIGHYRRYTARMLAQLTPPGLVHLRSMYLDAVGLAASLANRLAPRQSLPTRGQLRFWDRVLVPCSRLVDPLLAYRIGKSVISIWTRPGQPE